MLPSVSSHMNVPAPPLYGFTGTGVQVPGVPGTAGGPPAGGGVVVGGVVVGGVVVGGVVVGAVVGGLVGVVAVGVGTTAPVHTTPLTVNAVGTGLEPVQDPLNPK